MNARTVWRPALMLATALYLTTTAAAAELTATDALRLAQQHKLAAGAYAAHEAGEAEVRAAWVRAVAAHQALAALGEVTETLDLAAEFAQTLHKAGNLSALDLMRHQALQAEAAADLAVLRAELRIEEERLADLVGLGVPLALPAALADVPAATEKAPADAPFAVRAAYLRYAAAHERARIYRDTLVPLRRSITEETTLRFNGMLVDVFALLADVRERGAATLAAIEAQRDFWLADNALHHADELGEAAHDAPTLVLAPRGGGNGGH